jgi:DUF1365 family protein
VVTSTSLIDSRTPRPEAAKGEPAAPAAPDASGRHKQNALREDVLQSALYEGWVRHRRHVPHAHAFCYRIYMLYLDLDEIDEVFRGRFLWSVGRRNLAEFRRSDYLGDPATPLGDAIRERVRVETGRAPTGPIHLLAHLRYFGHCFNPVTFYYCYHADGTTLDTIVAEITNTPWKERHSYVLPVASAEHHASAHAWAFRKAFHVSPFLPMDRDYAWRFTEPGASLHVHMDVLRESTREFDATMVLDRRELNAANLARVLLRYPAMTCLRSPAIAWNLTSCPRRSIALPFRPTPASASSTAYCARACSSRCRPCAIAS